MRRLHGGAELADVLLFSGRTAAAAARLTPELWRTVDAAVCGPCARPLRASANQVLEILTPWAGPASPARSGPATGRCRSTSRMAL